MITKHAHKAPLPDEITQRVMGLFTSCETHRIFTGQGGDLRGNDIYSSIEKFTPSNGERSMKNCGHHMHPKQSVITTHKSTASHPDIIQETIIFWEKRCGTSISAEQAREMIANVTTFFSTLQKWDSACGNEIKNHSSAKNNKPAKK